MAQKIKNPPSVQETRVQSLGEEDSLKKGMATQVFLPGELRGQRSLVGYIESMGSSINILHYTPLKNIFPAIFSAILISSNFLQLLRLTYNSFSLVFWFAFWPFDSLFVPLYPKCIYFKYRNAAFCVSCPQLQVYFFMKIMIQIGKWRIYILRRMLFCCTVEWCKLGI